MKSRLLAAVAALALVAGVSLVSAAPASATATGTLRVQVQTVTGANWNHKGMYISAQNMRTTFETEARTDAAGVATLKVPSGKYTITVESYKTDYTYAISSQDYIQIARGQTKTIGMKVALGGRVAGTLTLPDGKPLKNARVAVTKDGQVINGFTTTDKRGRFMIRGLQSGKYKVIFNQRTWNNPKNVAIQTYGWTYWKGVTLGTSRPVRVYQANRFTGPTTVRHVNGSVDPSTTSHVTVTLTRPVGQSARLLFDNVNEAKQYQAAQSVYSAFTKGNQNVAALTVRTRLLYRIGVVYDGATYYYTGEYQPLTTDLKLATPVDVTSAYADFHLGGFPE